ncbi:MAG: dTDP-glucose 4,6-dehydratase [Gammaproteobacteria bacterium]|nr:dTDP-glucose 4,6-dehydratase [Gammaproteobacteria bacterium]
MSNKKQKKIIITGGMGFIGSAVIREAIALNFQVLNIDSLTYAASKETLKRFETNEKYSFAKVDIRNYEELSEQFNSFSPDFVMHLAAESHVDRSIDSPIDFLETNIMGTFNLLDIAYKYWVKSNKFSDFRFHHISTDEVFGSLGKTGFFTEDSSYKPNSPYSASKASSDHLVRAWNKTYGLPVVITNCSNNYGPFQFPEKLIPLIIINAISEKKLPVYGKGENIRDWLYVEDHANALLKVLQKGIVGSSYNIGGENEVRNIDIVINICKILDKLLPRESKYQDLITFVNDRPGHDQRYAIKPTKIVDELGWSPSISIDEGLEKTVKWYIDNRNWWEPLVNKNEIKLPMGKLN